VVTVHLPPLRQRPDDVPLLVDHFLRDITANKHTAPHRVSPEVMRRFQAYRWPGNVRELRNALERMMILADNEIMTENDLPSEILSGSEDITSAKEIPTGLTMDELERLAITKALDQCGGNRTHAAHRLGISVRTLQRKLRHYEKGIKIADDVLSEA